MTCRVLDHPGEALAHDLLKLHALLDDRVPKPALERVRQQNPA